MSKLDNFYGTLIRQVRTKKEKDAIKKQWDKAKAESKKSKANTK